MNSFSDQLRAEAEPIWREIFAHPFLRGIKDGTLPLETFQYYLGQDYLYLEGFARCVAIALAKAPTIEVIEEMAKRVMTPIERPLHHKLLAEAGLSEAEVARAQPSPTNAGYVNHMLAVANREGLGPTAAAMLPCPWTYHLLREELGQSEHPALRPVDQLLRFRPAGGQRSRLAQLRRPAGRACQPGGTGGHAAGVPHQQPLRVDVLGRRLPPRRLAGIATATFQRPLTPFSSLPLEGEG